MTRAPWAETIAENKWCDTTNVKVYALGLKAEHKRAVRVVNKLIKETELDQHRWTSLEQQVRMEALVDARTALQKDRT